MPNRKLSEWQQHVRNVSKTLDDSDKKNLFKIASTTWQSGGNRSYRLKLTPKQQQALAFVSDPSEYEIVANYDRLNRESRKQNTFPSVIPSGISEQSLNDLVQKGWIQMGAGCGCGYKQQWGAGCGCGYKQQRGAGCGCGYKQQRGAGLTVKLLLTPKQHQQIAFVDNPDDYDLVSLYDTLSCRAKKDGTFPLVHLTSVEHSKINNLINKGWVQHGGSCGEKLCTA